jgi:PHD/YefM family antitoxin component YafN of YafNO toxin-antitoxin module
MGRRRDDFAVRNFIMKTIFAEPEIVSRRGKPASVILPIADYEELLERAEDAHDVAALKRGRRKPLNYRPLGEYLAERKSKVRV